MTDAGFPSQGSSETNPGNSSVDGRRTPTNISPLIPWTAQASHSLKPGKNVLSNVKQSANEAPQEWKPFLLRLPTLLTAILATLALTLAVIALFVFSTKNRGITAVHTGEEKVIVGSAEFTLRLSLAWTFVPVFVVQLLILLVDAIVVASGARQPYIELRKGAPAERSIGLDYTAELAIKNPRTAFKLKHFVLLFSFSLMLLVNLVLTALAAHLLDIAEIQTSDSRAVVRAKQFSYDKLLSRDSFDPVFDVVTATRLYGGQQIPWTTPDYALLPVKLEGLPTTSNFSLNVIAYNVEIDCKVLNGPSEFRLGPINEGWEVETSDRGCASRFSFVQSLQSGTKEIIHTYQQPCSSKADWSRIIVVAALHTDPSVNTLTNKTAVSCTTAYYNTTGLLSLGVDSSRPSSPIVYDFVPQASNLFQPRPPFGVDFEEQINQATIVDPTNTISATDFGRLILDYAQSLSPHSYLEGAVLQRATQELYRSLFAVFANLYLVESATPSQILGTIHETQTRLVVVPVVAYLVIVILAAIEVMLIWIFLYTLNTESILYEEPKGLLGAATILRNSYLMDRVEGFGAASSNGKVATVLNGLDSSGETWLYADWLTPSKARLMTGKVIGTAH